MKYFIIAIAIAFGLGLDIEHKPQAAGYDWPMAED